MCHTNRSHAGRLCLFLVVVFAAAHLAHEHRASAAVDSDFDIVAQTGGTFTGFGIDPSINDDGDVAFVGQESGGESVFFWEEGETPANITGSPTSNRRFGRAVWLNNHDVVAVRQQITGTTIGTYRQRLYYANSLIPGGNFETIATGGVGTTSSHPDDFDAIFSFAAINNNIEPGLLPGSFNNVDHDLVYAALATGSTLVAVDTPPVTPDTGDLTFPSQTLVRPAIADDGRVIMKSGRESDSPLILWGTGLTGPGELIAGSSIGFTEIGVESGISDDSNIVGFYANLSDAGAAALNAAQPGYPELMGGEGIFASIATPSGRAVLRLAGRDGNGRLDPGEKWEDKNNDGQVDAGEDVFGFESFLKDSRVSISQTGEPGSNGLRFSFVGTTAGGSQGIYSGQIHKSARGILAAPTPVIQGGDMIDGLAGTVSSLNVFDTANNNDQLVFWTSTNAGNAAIVRATRTIDPVRQNAAPWGKVLYAPSQLDAFIREIEGNPKHPDYGYKDDLIELRDKEHYSIQYRGCWLSSMSMALRKMGLSDVTPAELHDKLQEIGGITSISKVLKSWVNFDGVKMFAFKGADPRFFKVQELFPELRRDRLNTAADVKSALDDGYLAMLNFRGHWVLAIEADQDGKIEVVNPWMYKDGDHDQAYTEGGLVAAGFQYGFKLFEDNSPCAEMESGCPVEVVITCPSGKRLGFDPLLGVSYEEILNSSYGTEIPVTDPENPFSDLELGQLAAELPRVASLNSLESGEYQIEVIGLADGDFALSFKSFNCVQDVDFSVSGAITAGQRLSYFATVVVPEPSTPGDANEDGKVDELDASILAINWLRTGDATWETGDFNGDGAVNDLDASILAANWLSGVGAAVPEPSCLVLAVGVLAMAASWIASRRRAGWA